VPNRLQSLICPTARARLWRRLHPNTHPPRFPIVPAREWWDAQNERARRATGPLWIALGDSIVQGIGATAPDRGYVGRLLERLRAGGEPWRVVNLSVSGARLNHVRAEQVPRAREVAAEEEPALVTCSVGVNDLFKPGIRPLPGRIRALMRALPPATVVATAPHGFLLGETLAFNAILRHEARAARMRIAEVWKHTGPPYRDTHCFDGFHPSDRGHERWCDAFAATLHLPPA
jgi:lysophospholipase L1-like esterase